MTGNGGRVDEVTYRSTRSADMSAFDRLPVAVRTALNAAPYEIAAETVLAALRAGCPEKIAIMMIMNCGPDGLRPLARDEARDH